MDSIKSVIYVEKLAEFVFMIQKGILLETVLMGTQIIIKVFWTEKHNIQKGMSGLVKVSLVFTFFMLHM